MDPTTDFIAVDSQPGQTTQTDQNEQVGHHYSTAAWQMSPAAAQIWLIISSLPLPCLLVLLPRCYSAAACCPCLILPASHAHIDLRQLISMHMGYVAQSWSKTARLRALGNCKQLAT